MRALRAGAIGPVCIRAWVDLGWVRMGPVVRNAGGGLDTGAMGASESAGGIADVAVDGLRV